MKKIIVIDSFYKNPYAIRSHALNKTEYLSPTILPQDFPGTESKKSFFSQALVRRMEKAIGEKIVVDPAKYSFGVFAKTYERDERKKVVHTDSSDWTGVVYLSRPEDCKGGTVFYEDIETGVNSIPSARKLLEMGYDGVEDFKERFLKPRAQEISIWRVSVMVGMKFNRLLLFRAGELFHSADRYFGTNDESCRLIQLFFFKTVN